MARVARSLHAPKKRAESSGAGQGFRGRRTARTKQARAGLEGVGSALMRGAGNTSVTSGALDPADNASARGARALVVRTPGCRSSPRD